MKAYIIKFVTLLFIAIFLTIFLFIRESVDEFYIIFYCGVWLLALIEALLIIKEYKLQKRDKKGKNDA